MELENLNMVALGISFCVLCFGGGFDGASDYL